MGASESKNDGPANDGVTAPGLDEAFISRYADIFKEDVGDKYKSPPQKTEDEHDATHCAEKCLRHVPATLPVLLVEDAIEEHVLEFASIKSQGTSCDIALPLMNFEDLDSLHHSEIAILSWRWDLQPGRHSINLQRALRCAKEANIQYLLIDVLSIDQSLPPETLRQRVRDFTGLYQDLPVITAYYHERDSLQVTIRRPWILHEVKRFGQSRNKVYYTYEQEDFNKEGKPSSLQRTDAMLWYSMTYAAHADYADSIARVLNGLTDGLTAMQCPLDFQYLLPEHGQILRVAHEQMNTADFLLTTLLLHLDDRWRMGGQYPCSPNNDLGWDHDAQPKEPYGGEMVLEWCSLHERFKLDAEEGHGNAEDAEGKVTALLLDNQRIGTLSDGERLMLLSLQMDTRFIILRALGLKIREEDFMLGNAPEGQTSIEDSTPQRTEVLEKMNRLSERSR